MLQLSSPADGGGPKIGDVRRAPSPPRKFDLATLVPGDSLILQADDGTWYITLTLRHTFYSSVVEGVSVMTDSPAAGRITTSPHKTQIGRYLQKGRPLVVNRGETGAIQAAWLNGHKIIS